MQSLARRYLNEPQKRERNKIYFYSHTCVYLCIYLYFITQKSINQFIQITLDTMKSLKLYAYFYSLSKHLRERLYIYIYRYYYDLLLLLIFLSTYYQNRNVYTRIDT